MPKSCLDQVSLIYWILSFSYSCNEIIFAQFTTATLKLISKLWIYVSDLSVIIQEVTLYNVHINQVTFIDSWNFRHRCNLLWNAHEPNLRSLSKCAFNVCKTNILNDSV